MEVQQHDSNGSINDSVNAPTSSSDRPSCSKVTNCRIRLLLILFSFILLLLAAISNPDTAHHREVVKTKGYAFFQESLKNELAVEKTSLLGNALGSLLGKPLIGVLVDNIVESRNFVFFSLTTISNDDETNIIGLGLFGNVILHPDMEEKLVELFSDQDISF